MRKNLKKAAVALCISLCFAGVFTGCSGGENTKQNTNAKADGKDKEIFDSENIEDVKGFEVDPNEKAEFSFEGAQGDETDEGQEKESSE